MNRTEFHQRFLLRLACHPVTLVPFAGGVTALAVAWAGDLPKLVFLGIVGIVASVGAGVTRLIFRGEHIAREVHEDMEKRKDLTVERQLDDLRERLVADRDPRDNELLDELREIVRVFRTDTGWSKRVNSIAAAEIASSVDELFAVCVRKLEASYDHLQTTKNLRAQKAKKALLDQRERLLTEVVASVHELSELLAGVYQLGISGSEEEEQATAVRSRLQQSLELARRVDAVMNPRSALGQRERSEQ